MLWHQAAQASPGALRKTKRSPSTTSQPTSQPNSHIQTAPIIKSHYCQINKKIVNFK